MKNIRVPLPLKQGDKIMIVSPSGKVEERFIAGAEKRLASWGFAPVRGKYCAGSFGRFSGSREERLSDLMTAVSDETVKGVFCSRGGYGAVQLLDRFASSIGTVPPKWLIGYSDITLLHACFRWAGVASMHAPMCRHLYETDEEDEASCWMKKILSGSFPVYDLPSHPLNRPGTAEGRLAGGNLSVLYGLRGTRFDFDPEGTILFLEDIGEAPYRVERMMYNLELGGVLSRLSGLIVGQFTGYSEDPSLGYSVYEMFAEMVRPYDYPVCFDFPVGHVKDNYPVIIGGSTRLSVTSGGTCFSQFPEAY